MRRSITMLALILGLLVGALPAWADSPEGPVHIALGDSQAFGFGTPRPDKLGYVAVLNRWLTAVDCTDGEVAVCPHLELVDLSVPGAETGDLIADQLPAAIQIIGQRNNDAYPDNDVTYITVTIGGNDLNHAFAGNCLPGGTSEPGCLPAITAAFTQAANNLVQILGTLRAVTGPETRIVTSTYDNPFPACNLAPFAPFADMLLEGGPGFDPPLGFNDVIRLTAAATQSEVAETYGLLGIDDWVGGSDCTHPDISGYHKIADVFLEVLD